MHTIEAAVLVPLGIGLVVVLMMFSFCLHDQVVLAAECATLMLEWQQGGEVDEDEDAVESGVSRRMLITDVECSVFSCGKAWCRMKLTEDWRVFQRGLALLSLSDAALTSDLETARTKSFSLIKIDPCWLKRIWRVSGLE